MIVNKMKPSNCTIICWDAEKPYNNELGKFDVITLTDVLHHADFPIAILKNVSNYATDDTIVLISEFDPESLGFMGPPLKHRLPLAEVKLMIEPLGFDIISEGTLDFEHYYLLIKKHLQYMSQNY